MNWTALEFLFVNHRQICCYLSFIMPKQHIKETQNNATYRRKTVKIKTLY